MPESPYEAQPMNGDARPLVTTHRDSGRVLVTIVGELCLDDSEMLGRKLRAALDGPQQGVDLDLSGVKFWDCATLNVLLTARRQALAEGKTIAVTAASHIVERLLTLTDTHSLLVPSRQKADVAPGRSEVAHLHRAMQTRPEIDLARINAADDHRPRTAMGRGR
ncbi:hypothetical protein AQI88_15870 [Streptomyces cellostaticus]|uniref:STAS domain-containing protein n=2 Tax=Streptomyces cellostaticus TaxID=67285 RepID=A0A124HCU8_9ACTN|nr:STAS domain-containing protein [Streptomyces cellostaticus]KUM95558.1 hypothetical protein AQI88_15870 [Streptomyces cellostaticus]GHI09868.1 hypothetical protein Scel_81890 [Streptomyces cellostaticus]